MTNILLSHSAVSDFKACPRYGFLRRVKRIFPVGERGRALSFGDAFHRALAVYWEAEVDSLEAALAQWASTAPSLSWEDQVIGRALLIGYSVRWGTDQQYRISSVPLAERKVVLPVAPGLDFIGVFDVVVSDEWANTGVIDHKTTQGDLGSEAFVARQHESTQYPLYVWALREAGRECTFALVDAVRAPQLKRRLATPLERREFYVRDSKHGSVGDPKPGTRLLDETPDEFTERVLGDIAANPTSYYSRFPLTYSDADLTREHADLVSTGRLIERCVEIDDAPRNRHTCRRFPQHPCEYIPLCFGQADATDERLYKIKPRREHNG